MTTASIFIVEDEIITARSIAKNLKNLGYEIAGIATDGAEAIAKILELKPDLVLMDISLRKSPVDGISVAENIRTQLNIPIVYLTAHSDEQTLERAKVTIPLGYIIKPFSQRDLQITLKLALYKHRQESELIAREKLFSDILNSTQDSIVATDEISRVTYMNPAAQRLTGWQIEEALKQKASKVVPIIDARTERSLPHSVERVIEQGNPVHLGEHTILITKNGGRIPITDSASPIFRQGEHIAGVVLIFAEQRQISSLSNLVNESAVSDELQSLSDLDLSTRLNNFGCDLLEFIVHELRAPLAIVLSSSESLRYYRQRWTQNKQNRSFNKIRQAVEQMNQLLDNVSTWKQVDNNRLSARSQLVDLTSICQEVVSDIGSNEGDRHEIVFTALIDDSTAYLDPLLLKYALNNLLANAVKYSPPASTIYVTLAKPEDSFVIEIRDRGLGVPPSEQPYLFDSFYRASNVGNISGTGLGLAIAKKCIEIQQGKIGCESEVGRGTTFIVTLPSSYDPSNRSSYSLMKL